MIVVDASFALKVVLDEDDSPQVRSRWASWAASGEQICAPILFRAESLSAVRRRAFRGSLTVGQADRAYHVLAGLGVEFREPGNLYEVALAYAERFDRPAVYDSCYLALADILGCEMWTADRRLANAAAALPWIRTP